MDKAIIITTINDRTEAIRRFELISGWNIILVGDRKTPEIHSTKQRIYLSLAAQHELGLKYPDLCPTDHYCRKNVGYLYAFQQGATVLADTDDDNIPYESWCEKELYCATRIKSNNEFANVYRHFTNELIWPRGFPLDHIRDSQDYTLLNKPTRIGVWQGLADGDPDVDAIHRLLFSTSLKFTKHTDVCLDKWTYCPFNSQNTQWAPGTAELMYLPSTVTFRFTDILRGYVAQRLLWEMGLHLGFTSATVYQERNAHDLMRDLKDEIPCYISVHNVVEILNSLALTGDPASDMRAAYSALYDLDIVGKDELPLLDAWLEDIKNCRKNT